MAESMRRGRSQAIWRYAPGATFRYNDNSAWCRTIGITLRDPVPLDGALAEAVSLTLRRWNAIEPEGMFPDPLGRGVRYVVGTPHQVEYEVWPLAFTCRQCGLLDYYQTVENLRRANDALICKSCKAHNQLRQVPYVFVCECGQIETVFAPRHEHRAIQLVDRRNFQESYWFCRECNRALRRNPRDGLGFRSCSCRPGKTKRGMLLEDSRVYMSQTFAMVDIEPKSVEPWRENPGFTDLLLAAALEVPAYRPGHLLDLARTPPTSVELPEPLRAMRRLLIQSGKTEEEADALVRAAARQSGGGAWEDIQNDLVSLRDLAGPPEWRSHRRTVEYVFVRDDPHMGSLSLDELIADAGERGDGDATARLSSERDLATQIGLRNLRVVQALPVMLAGIGYTRYRSMPQDGDEREDSGTGDPARLRPYSEQDGKIPLYVARNTTEALLYEVDPWRLAAFLEINTGLRAPRGHSPSRPLLKAWLLGLFGDLVARGEAHLTLRPFERERGVVVHEPSALAFGVLHTLSHVLKATAHRFVGVDTDALAEYLFPAHSVGLLYVSSQVQFTLGGVDAVFRGNLTQWLGSARDFAGRCSFDPVCADSGGACLACLYPRFGCSYFNRTVSRSFLMGGPIAGRDGPLQGFWSAAVIRAANQMRAQAGGER